VVEPEPSLSVVGDLCRVNVERCCMARVKHTAHRRDEDYSHRRPLHGRALSARRYLELGRRPRLADLPAPRPPYVELAVTAAVFLFLFFMVLGGASPT
jgi:hypothetical protein